MARRQDPDCATHPLATSLSQSHAPGHSSWSLWSVGETHHKQVFQVVWFDSLAWQVGWALNVTFADI
ncbi:hypothetical protein QC762_0061820 [Podospora pseudocomata]|uniref:Uncharacterized protein n=1 Tax=Podospora pseudocomata TaxID=2093779 RepID=A0ABR0GE91_9PEZI|nr:hypothetical protein QC762_0061820 [Podospora pseudocomata]